MTNSSSQKKSHNAHSAEHSDASLRIDNLIKNNNFDDGFDHWEVDDKGDPDNCKTVNGSAELKNQGTIAQQVEVASAAPYTLRFKSAGIGANLAEIVENGVVTQTANPQGGDFKLSFVTRESTASLQARFTGLNATPFYLNEILLFRDVPDLEERVRNGEFDFGGEGWTTQGTVRFYDGLCVAQNNAHVTQIIRDLVPGATYKFHCTTQAFSPFYFGRVYISIDRPEGPSEQPIFELKEHEREYSLDLQVTSETLTLVLVGFDVAFDSISIKRVSVG